MENICISKYTNSSPIWPTVRPCTQRDVKYKVKKSGYSKLIGSQQKCLKTPDRYDTIYKYFKCMQSKKHKE